MCRAVGAIRVSIYPNRAQHGQVRVTNTAGRSRHGPSQGGDPANQSIQRAVEDAGPKRRCGYGPQAEPGLAGEVAPRAQTGAIRFDRQGEDEHPGIKTAVAPAREEVNHQQIPERTLGVGAAPQPHQAKRSQRRADGRRREGRNKTLQPRSRRINQSVARRDEQRQVA